MTKIEGDLAAALKLLCDYFEQRHIPFAMVGALVPALLLSSEIAARETRDADHVIKLSSWADWEAVIADLVKLGFTRGGGEQEHSLHYKNAEIDLIPYGVTNGPDDVLVWRRSGNQMTMTGFSDVFKYAVPTEVTPGVTFPVVPLWLFAALKIITYCDRKFPRDLSDLAYVLEQYEPIGGESRRFEIIGEAQDVSYDTAGAYLLGRDIREKASPPAVGMVKDFIESIAGEYDSALNIILSEENRTYSKVRRHEVFELIKAFRSGLCVGL